jgi:DNA segregation ATPase FtsK/SpoIIIE, S-DNA-T family
LSAATSVTLDGHPAIGASVAELPWWARPIPGIGPALSAAERWVTDHADAIALPLGGALLVLVVVTAGLKQRRPASYWRLLGWRLAARLIRRRWRELAENCGLTTRSHKPGGLRGAWRTATPGAEHLRVPRLRRIRRAVGGLVVTVKTLPGQKLAMYVNATEAMVNEWGVHSVRATQAKPGWITLTVMTEDSLLEVHHPRPAVPPPPRATASVTKDPAAPAVCPSPGASALRVTVGRREDGSPWVLDLSVQHHTLIAGVTRSGKSNLLNAAVVGWARVPNLALVGIDLKRGIELGDYRPRLSALARDLDQAVAVLRGLVAEMLNRYDRLDTAAGAKSIWDLPGDGRPPAVVVIIDEAAELFLSADRADKQACEQAAGLVNKLVRLGAAAGLHVVMCGQRIGSDLGATVTGTRSQLTGRICHRVPDPETAKMVFPERPDAVEAVLSITPRQQGMAIALDADNQWQRVRSFLTTSADAITAATGYTHLTPHLPGLADGRDDIKTVA